MHYKSINNIVFIGSLLLLLVNDFYLKMTFHNGITGKLSDISGVIVFALLLTCMAYRYKKWIFISTAVGFAFWKSIYSQSLINFWNTLELFAIHRVVDYSDILAVLVLIPVYYYTPKEIPNTLFKKVIGYPLIGIALFSIIATSQIHYDGNHLHINRMVHSRLTKEAFLHQLRLDHIKISQDTITTIVVKDDILERYILNDIIIENDTIYRAIIGLKKKKNQKTLVYIESLQLYHETTENRHYIFLSTYKDYKKWTKKYRILTKKYFRKKS